MVTIPGLEDYSKKERDEACKLSPALSRYIHLLNKTHNTFNDELRKSRHLSWTQAAMATILRSSPTEDICTNWSLQSEGILQNAWEHFELQKEPLCLLSLGKLGARELNLSSDVDVIFVNDGEPTPELSKKVRQWIQSLSSVNEFGFCYRIDLNIRPGGPQAPMISSFDYLTNYYGYHGETWERMAMVRLRGLWGPSQTLTATEEFCHKFSFRRHLDYSLFYDLVETRNKLRDFHYENENNNIKFCRGGIRELELFVNALQLIHGSKYKDLVTTSTSKAINELKNSHLIAEDDADFLLQAYWSYRTLENKIQCIGDQHTYTIPDLKTTQLISKSEIDSFREKAQYVASLVNDFLKPYESEQPLIDESKLEEQFKKLNIASAQGKSNWSRLIKATAKSKESSRDEKERKQFLQAALELIEEHSADKELAVSNLSQFVSKTRAKSSFFALFNKHQSLISEVIWIFSYSPYLSQILINRPELIDSFLIKSAEIDTEDEEHFHISIQEYKMLSDLIASSAFLRNRNLQLLCENLSQTTETILLHLLNFFSKQLDVEPLKILTLGKWAAKEMGLKSDLDFVFISNNEMQKEKHSKLARRLINAIQSNISGLALYDIDLRLRPSGHAGPLLLNEHELKKYLEDKSMAWERQAYLRARYLGEDKSTQLYQLKPFSSSDLKELKDIQKKLLTNSGTKLDLKTSYGGITHTEFTLQLATMQLGTFPPQSATRALVLLLKNKYSPTNLDKILHNYEMLRVYQQLMILLSQTSIHSFDEKSPAFQKLNQLLQTSNQEKMAEIKGILTEQKSLLQELDPL